MSIQLAALGTAPAELGKHRVPEQGRAVLNRIWRGEAKSRIRGQLSKQRQQLRSVFCIEAP